MHSVVHLHSRSCLTHSSIAFLKEIVSNKTVDTAALLLSEIGGGGGGVCVCVCVFVIVSQTVRLLQQIVFWKNLRERYNIENNIFKMLPWLTLAVCCIIITP